jgi:hypothetical protein
MGWARCCIVMSLLISAAGCYYYQPLETPAPQLGTYMQVSLTDSGTSHFWGYLGPDVGNVRGRLLTTNPEALALSVESVEQRHGQVLGWKGETVTLSRAYVATLQERHLSKPRTALLAGGTVVGLIAAVRAFANLASGSGGGGGGGPPR